MIKIPRDKLKGEEKYKTISVRMPIELYNKLFALSTRTELSRNQVINILLEEACDLAEIEDEKIKK